MARQHPGTINLRYLAPPAAVGLVAVGTLAGLAGLCGLAAGAGGAWPQLLTIGFALPLGYAAGILAVASYAARRLPFRVAAKVPLALITMHMSWGSGFLTSPRSLVPGARRDG